MIEIHAEIDLTGVAMRTTMHIAEIGVSLGCAAAGRTKQIPGHIENTSPRGTQAHLQHRSSVDFPMVSQGIRPNPLDRQFIRAVQKIFQTCHQ
jgi:hypothetical protein